MHFSRAKLEPRPGRASGCRRYRRHVRAPPHHVIACWAIIPSFFRPFPFPCFNDIGIAQACLGTLLHVSEEVTKESLESFPPAEYAAEHHIDHSQYKNVPQNTQDEMKQ